MLVGGGFALRTQLPAFRLLPAADVRALVGRDPTRTRELARVHAIPIASTDLGEVLERVEIDLVCVTTPPDLHRAFGLAALAAGKHVLCEKPMALDSAEAESMCRAARAAPGCLALVDHELRFAPALVKMRRLVHEGYAGTPLHVLVTVLEDSRLDPARPFDWWSDARRGGGVLGAVGSHVIDWLRWTFGDVEAAAGVRRTLVGERPAPGELRPRRVDSDDHATFVLRVSGAAPMLATVVLSVVAHRGSGLRFEVFGSEGMLRHDAEGRLWGSRRDPAARHQDEQPPLEELTDPDPLPATDRKRLPDSLWALGFAHLARALVEAIAGDRGDLPEAARFADGLEVQRVLDALRGLTPPND